MDADTEVGVKVGSDEGRDAGRRQRRGVTAGDAVGDAAGEEPPLEVRLRRFFAAERADVDDAPVAPVTSVSVGDFADGECADGEPLVAYLHLRRGTPSHTKAVLEEHVRTFADREGYDLRRLLIGVEGGSDLLTLRALVEHIEATGAVRVLVVGPARQALVALGRLSGVQVLTLAQVRPTENPTLGSSGDPAAGSSGGSSGWSRRRPGTGGSR